jgi:hypothetical protein
VDGATEPADVPLLLGFGNSVDSSSMLCFDTKISGDETPTIDSW